MTDLTVNIRGLTVPTPNAAAALRTLGSRWALVESNPGMARELAVQGWRVVYRDYWPEQGDDNQHLKVTPQQFIDHIATLNLPDGAIIIAGNEPTRQYAELVIWTLEVMRLARARGWRLAVGSFATGNPSQFDWDDVLLPLLEALQDGWHVLSLHEYVATAYKISTPWHIGRFQYALDACRVHGLKPPRIFITETGMDVTGSWQSLGLSAAAFAGEMEPVFNQVYRPAGIDAAFLFSLGKWSIEHSGHLWEFDVTPALEELAKIGQGSEPMDMDTREAGIVKPAGQYANIRASANGQDVGDLVGPHATQRTVETVSAAGLVWRHYAFEDGTVSGWIADSAVGWTPAIVPAPVPEPEPTPEPEPQPAPAASWVEFLRNQREMLIAQRTAIDIQLEYIEQELNEAA